MRRAVDMTEAEDIEDAGRLVAMLRSIAECPLPVVARVQGGAFGGGVGIVAAADVVIAVDSARFGSSEARLGLVPATIAPWTIAKIGAGWARKLFVTAERFDAALALRIGLVHEVVEEAKLDEAVAAAVDSLLLGGREANRGLQAAGRHPGPGPGTRRRRLHGEHDPPRRGRARRAARVCRPSSKSGRRPGTWSGRTRTPRHLRFGCARRGERLC